MRTEFRETQGIREAQRTVKCPNDAGQSRDAAWRSPAWRSAAWRSTAWNRAVRPRLGETNGIGEGRPMRGSRPTTRHGKAWHGMARHGMMVRTEFQGTQVDQSREPKNRRKRHPTQQNGMAWQSMTGEDGIPRNPRIKRPSNVPMTPVRAESQKEAMGWHGVAWHGIAWRSTTRRTEFRGM